MERDQHHFCFKESRLQSVEAMQVVFLENFLILRALTRFLKRLVLCLVIFDYVIIGGVILI